MSEKAGDGDVEIGAFRSWLSVGILMLLMLVSNIDRTMLSLLVDPIRASLRISDFGIGLLQGLAFGLFYAFFGVPMGWLLDRFRRPNVLYCAVSIWSLSAAACGLAGNYAQLFFARLGVGAGEAAVQPGAYAIIGSLFPPRRLALAISIYAIGAVLGSALALSVGGIVIEALTARGPMLLPWLGTLQPWQLAFIITGLPGLLIAPLVFLIPSPRVKSADAPAPDRKGTFSILRNKAQYHSFHFLGFGSIVLMAYGMAAWTPAHLTRHFGLDLRQVGSMVGGVSVIGGIAGFLFAGWVTDRWFQRGIRNAHFRYALIMALILVPAGVIGFLSDNLYVCIAAIGIIHFAICVSGGAAAHLQLSTPVAYRGRISAIYVLVVNVMGLVAGPMIVAAFTDFLFGDPAKVGQSIALTYAIVGSAAAVLFYCGLRPATTAIEEIK